MISADTLVLLSDIDGLYDADPRHESQARHIATLNEINAETEAMAGKPSLGYSSGGMATKLQAAKISLAAGCRMAIALGTEPHPLRLMDEGARCTWFVPQANPMTARKRWIAGSLQPMGIIVIDDGAVNALGRGTSLLPAGVTEVKGTFERGDLVSICAVDGREVARGLSAYANGDATLISGHKSGEIEAVLGYRGRDELIHRDDLVLS
jgi:glutamate 5-kinase